MVGRDVCLCGRVVRDRTLPRTRRARVLFQPGQNWSCPCLRCVGADRIATIQTRRTSKLHLTWSWCSSTLTASAATWSSSWLFVWSWLSKGKAQIITVEVILCKYSRQSRNPVFRGTAACTWAGCHVRGQGVPLLRSPNKEDCGLGSGLRQSEEIA